MNYLKREDVGRARELIEASTDLRVEQIEVGPEGCENVIFRVNQDYIFRFPRAEWNRFSAETWALSAVAGRTTLQTPVVEFLGGDRSFIGYRAVPGVPLLELMPLLSEERLWYVASQVGEFLHEIHSRITDADPALLWLDEGVKVAECERFLISDRCPDAWKVPVEEALARYAAVAPPTSHFFLHNDLHGENLLADLDRQCLVGVIDFGDVRLGDYHREFYSVGWASYEFMHLVAADYEKRTGLVVDRQRIHDEYLLESVVDISDGTYDCSEDLDAFILNSGSR